MVDTSTPGSTPTDRPAENAAPEPQEREYEVSITNHFMAASPQEAVEQMIEWLIGHGGASNGAYQVIEDEIDAEPVTIDASDL